VLLGTPVRISRRAPIMGNSCALSLRNGQLNPLSSEASETPASWEEHLSPCSPNSDNPDVLAPWISRVERRITVARLRSELGRLSLQRLLLGILSTANLSRAPQKWGPHLAAARSRPCISPIHLGSRLQRRKDH